MLITHIFALIFLYEESSNKMLELSRDIWCYLLYIDDNLIEHVEEEGVGNRLQVVGWKVVKRCPSTYM